MIKSKQAIIDSLLEKYSEYRTFENEHFIFWILNEVYIYDQELVSREEFQCVKKFAVHYSTLPNLERFKSYEASKQQKSDDIFEDNYKTRDYTYSCVKVLRYSKTYDSLELYDFKVNIKPTFKNNYKKAILIKRKNKVFSVNSKGFVRVGKRWLSLKNCETLSINFPDIRGNTVKFLLYSMLGQTWATDYYNQRFSLSNKNVRLSSSFEEAIDRECGAAPANILKKFFRDDVNSLIFLYRLLEPNKIHDITNFIKNHKTEIIGVSERLNQNKAKVLLFCYFICRDNRCDMQVLFDYFQMALDTGTKINLKISSYSTLKRNHDELNRKTLLKLSSKGQRLKISKVFPNMKSISGLDVENIKTVQRLNQESSELHHCVHGYKDLINSGDSAIYRLTFDSNPYTLQVKAWKEKINNEKSSDYQKEEEYIFKLKLNQLKGKYNSNPPEEIKPFLYRICEQNGILTDSVNDLYFHQANKDKRKVVQVGSKILEKIEYMGRVKLFYEDEIFE